MAEKPLNLLSNFYHLFFLGKYDGHSHGALRKRRRRSWLDKKTPGDFVQISERKKWHPCVAALVSLFATRFMLEIIQKRHVNVSVITMLKEGTRGLTGGMTLVWHQKLKLSILGASIIWAAISISYRYQFISVHIHLISFQIIIIDTFHMDPYICPITNRVWIRPLGWS